MLAILYLHKHVCEAIKKRAKSAALVTLHNNFPSFTHTCKNELSSLGAQHKFSQIILSCM